MRRLIRFCGAAALGGLLLACQSLPAQFGVRQAEQPATIVAADQANPGSPSGGVVFTVRWPDRAAQYIPASASAIRFGAYRPGVASPLATGSVARTLAPTASLAFTALPVETLRFTAEAMDPDGYVGASGSVTVPVLPNTLTPVKFTLASTLRPTLTGFSPANGCPGQQVTLTGTDFGFSRDATYSISFGGVVLPSNRIFRFSDTAMGFFVPPNATNSAIAVTVSGVSAASTLGDSRFTTIATLSVSPRTATLAPGEHTLDLLLSAQDAFGNEVMSPVVPWGSLGQDCSACGTSDSVARIDASGRVTRANVTGVARFGAGIAPVLATVSIEVQ
ncbi:IPT/TIG domain-containing protein [bacterium]|nr:IPT/TIG domain-containing protein [bacterium]